MNEVIYNLERMHTELKTGEGNYEHCFNNFLSSAQAVFWQLNKVFSKSPGYDDWMNSRGERLPEDSKIFKELRNISLKEEPIENSGVSLGWEVVGGLPAHATFTSPWINTKTGRPAKGPAQVKTKDGKTYEAEIIEAFDFSVSIEKGGKDFQLPHVISSARNYLEAIKKEVAETEDRFLVRRPNERWRK